jgi:hypothetical protein
MKRVVGCLVVSLLASASVWVGCRDELGTELQPEIIGSGTDSGVGGDAYGGTGSGTDAAGEGSGTDAAGEGSGTDAMGSGSSADAAGEGSGTDAMGSGSSADAAGEGSGGSGDAMGSGDAGDADPSGGGDASGTGNPLRPGNADSLDRTSFYACDGGRASTGLEVGLPIGLALALAVRRRRRWPGSADRRT